MPIKVRCGECQEVLEAPDGARGKVIRCSKCQGKVRVPSGKRRKGSAAKQPKPDSGDFLAGLDLSDAEDTSVRICTKCGTEVSEEARECAKCGIDLSTGELGKSARRRRGKKGPDPALFYKIVWKDSWRFMVKNKSLAIRTAVYSILLGAVGMGCLFMVLWCHRDPPKVFWGFLASISFLSIPGWLWHLHMEIISGTLQKKDRLKRVNFDLFVCTALGLKTFFWFTAIQVGLSIGGGGLIAKDMLIPGLALIGVGSLLALMILPLAMVHMTMVVTIPGWQIHKMLPVLLKNFAPTLYWCVILFVTSIPLLGCLGAIGAVSGNDIGGFIGTLQYNNSVASAQDEANAGAAAEGAAAPAGESKLKPLPWKSMIVPGVIAAFVPILIGFVGVFNMRSNGLLAYYFKDNLSLITLVKEKKYVSQAEVKRQQAEKKELAKLAKEEAKRKKLEAKEQAQKKRR